MDVVFGTFRPQNPAVNAHHGIIKVDHHIAEQPEIKENVHIQGRRNYSCRVNPNVFLDRKIDTRNSKKSGDCFQENFKSRVGSVWFQEKVMEIHGLKDNSLI
ncbi:hypothetical protein SDC9_168045 [bioreactor metagenome]|uniref:Uncharacterized protein n=1 Tax=bioreactor metagenome TaxID=1076179 RepID=A0A645G3G3_9ZZZZ